MLPSVLQKFDEVLSAAHEVIACVVFRICFVPLNNLPIEQFHVTST